MNLRRRKKFKEIGLEKQKKKFDLKKLNIIGIVYRKLSNRFNNLTPFTILIICAIMLFIVLTVENYLYSTKILPATNNVMLLIHQWEGIRASADMITILLIYCLLWTVTVLKYRARKPQVIMKY